MAKFDENKIINSLHPEFVDLNKSYWFADSAIELKRYVEEDWPTNKMVMDFSEGSRYPFKNIETENSYPYCYPAD